MERLIIGLTGKPIVATEEYIAAYLTVLSLLSSSTYGTTEGQVIKPV